MNWGGICGIAKEGEIWQKARLSTETLLVLCGFTSHSGRNPASVLDAAALHWLRYCHCSCGTCSFILSLFHPFSPMNKCHVAFGRGIGASHAMDVKRELFLSTAALRI